MKTKVLCIIAGAVLAMSVSSTAAAGADDGAAKPSADSDKPKAVAAVKEPDNGNGHVPGAQQNKMKHCNEEAKKKELKGDERRAFMSTCLKG
jgi:TolA-binding protein